MTVAEIAVWSACAGVCLSYTCLTGFYAIYNRSRPAIWTVLFVLITGLFIAITSGLAFEFVRLSALWQQYLMLGTGPIAGILGALGLRDFLGAEHRDKIVDRGMLFVAMLSALQLTSLWVPDYKQALLWSAFSATVCSVLTFWLSLRSWLLGDRFAMPMTLACAALLFGVMGLYGNATGVTTNSLVTQAITAALCALYVVICCHTIKRRHAEYLRMRKTLAMGRDKDLLTQLLTGAALIHHVDEAIARARRNRKEMAVIYVEISNTAVLRKEFSHNGVEQVIYGMAARVRQVSGSAVTVGRYSDTSFVVILDSVKQPSLLRTIGLRLAVAARRPYTLNPYSSSPREFRAEVGVGVARVSAGREAKRRQSQDSTQMAAGFDSFSLAQDVLHEAAELALAARAFNSRAAITDAYSRKVVPLEKADLK